MHIIGEQVREYQNIKIIDSVERGEENCCPLYKRLLEGIVVNTRQGT